ncbi:lantibiotic dehydratase [Hymenobacter terrestris]|uniref:Lantibiotic dehydratase n=1 Tax=Hymenobacter terrestris TaxID=2748310 RepID=A0ABX2Q4L5_9BACT|nr:lantibiotic dehydratase [Hymenobacter terrestris]NVO85879.1 lantibiotic dehydratase [Hymenobacter terrestris]
MTDAYHFYPELILRAPLCPFDPAISDEQLAQSLTDQAFMEALYLASPALHAECGKWQRGEVTEPRRVQRLRGAVVRYLTRMRSRCTPFGLFAGCSVLGWGSTDHVELQAGQHRRHTRLDMHYLCALAQHLAEHDFVREQLRYWPNSSWYRIGEEVRYVEHQYLPTERIHQISSLEADAYVEQVLAACADGRSYAALLTELAPDEADQQEAAAFLDALIAAQVLVSELEPTVTGPEFFDHLRGVVRRLQANAPPHADHLAAISQALTQVAELLTQLDRQPANTAADYQRIIDALQPLGVPIEADKLFQTDAVLALAEPGIVDAATQAQLRQAIDLLSRLAPRSSNRRLEEFKRQFQARYEEQEVPLLEVLDTESGIPYSDFGRSSYSPLVYDLELPANTTDARAVHLPDERQQFMHHKLREAERQQHYAVTLTPAEVQRFALPPAPLPASLGIMFRPLAGGRLLLDSASGSSAVNLLGRFAHAAPRIAHIVHDISQQEQAHNPGVAFAELCHLPGRRVGNILQRPSFRTREIPYLAQSVLPAQDQVHLQDLTLALRRGQLEIRSRRTGELIVPRLGTAHNYTLDSLPVYELLCDLQHQGLQSYLKFGWESVALTAPFLPRLSYQQVVLEAASWHLPAAEFQPLCEAPAAELPGRWQAFRLRWQLPRFFTLADGDNELLVDADNPVLVDTWLDSIRSRPTIRLKEFLFDPAASLVRDAQGQPYVAQLIALLVRQTPCYAPASARPALASAAVQRNFSLGSEWLYHKLYCGPKMANRVLRQAVVPLIEELQAQGLIDQWFFVRYADPAPHLRLRLHLTDTQRIGEVVQLVRAHLQPCIDRGYIWKDQTDTYCRELERYGRSTMALSEMLFGYQSAAYLQQLVHTAPEDEAQLWLWSVRAIDELLDAFDLATGHKKQLLGGLQEAFAAEFGVDKALKRQLDAKYRHFRPDIQQQLAGPADGRPDPQLRAVAEAIQQQVRTYPDEVSLAALLSSYIHMLLNRLIPADARLHELVLYDFLYRHYDSCLARQKV